MSTTASQTPQPATDTQVPPAIEDTVPSGAGNPIPPAAPSGINHVVLNVADMEESHHFWADLLGFQQVGTLADGYGPSQAEMRFYSGTTAEGLAHHHLALIGKPRTGTTPKLREAGLGPSIAHIAVSYPDQQSWLAQLEFLAAQGVELGARVDHGMTHSVYLSDPNGYGVELLYELPREVWEGDINAALNYADVYEPADALTDNTEYTTFGS